MKGQNQTLTQQQQQQPLQRRVFTEEFKREAVRLAEELGNTAQAARDLGLHESVLQRWKSRLRSAPVREVVFPGHGHVQDPELARLQRENRRLREEVEILKKAVGIFSIRPL